MDIWINFEVFFNLLGIRDHFIHNFETFLIGCYFINNIFKDERIREGKDLDNMLFSWVLTSTFHDIGYPIEHYIDLNRKLSGLYRQLQLTTISNQLDRLNLGKETLDELYSLYIPVTDSAYGEEKRINLRYIIVKELQRQFDIDESYADEIISSFDYKLQHGLVSTCILMKEVLITHGTNYLDSYWYGSLKEAAVAILMHHFSPLDSKDDLDIRLENVPMVVMLLLCDELQEWNRSLDDFGLDDFKGRLEYELDGIAFMQTEGMNIIAIELTVENNIDYTDNEVAEIISKTLEEKKTRFELIKISEIGLAFKINLSIKYKDQQVVPPLEKIIIN
jgi:hypothetical protein